MSDRTHGTFCRAPPRINRSHVHARTDTYNSHLRQDGGPSHLCLVALQPRQANRLLVFLSFFAPPNGPRSFSFSFLKTLPPLFVSISPIFRRDPDPDTDPETETETDPETDADPEPLASGRAELLLLDSRACEYGGREKVSRSVGEGTVDIEYGRNKGFKGDDG